MAFIEAYFDDSGTHLDAEFLTVAGYIFERNQARQLDREWRAVLHRQSLPFFHMVDCAHGNGHFRDLSKSQRLEVEVASIALVHRYAEKGIAVSLNEREFTSSLPSQEALKNAYVYCCWMCLIAVRNWIEEKGDEIEGVAFFFEAGHKHQGDANTIMNDIASITSLRNAYKYQSHQFITKEHACAVQAADMLAWLHGNALKKRLERKSPRQDYIALVENTKHSVLVANNRMCRRLFRQLGLLGLSVPTFRPLSSNMVHGTFGAISF